MGSLKCENIKKVYGKKEVLKDVNLELESGKIYGLIGKPSVILVIGVNGVGKTTLLSILSSQNPAGSGRVTLDGEDVWENEKCIDRICFSREISQMSGFGQNNLKIKDYMTAASIFYPNWNRELAKELIEKFGLEPKKRISKLSKGMLSMVTIVIALASEAEYTFLDEPVAGLDVVARDQFYKLLLHEYGKSGRTFVISTHIIEEAADIFEEVIMLDRGEILLKENTQELLERAYHVSGKSEDVEAATAGLTVYEKETMGRSTGVTVLLKEGESLNGQYPVSVQKLTLEKLFVAMCGAEV